MTSLSPGQITSDNATTRHLARYLDYAERGTAALALDLSESMGDADSPFEEEVIRSVRELGYDAVPQVGVAGYRVDIGVRHPTEPGSYVLGIECDGATYHSSKVARDRDRLRQGVLEGLDWRIHRIWSTAWFSDRPAEVARLQRSIEAALRGDLPASAAVEEPQDPEIIEGLADFDEPPEWAWVYESPVVAPPRTTARFHEVQARPVLVEQIRTAVIDSGPIHIDDVLAALRDAWGLGRAGERIRTAFDQAVGQLRSRGEVVQSGQFLSAPGEETFVRVPDEGEVPRKASRIPPEELQLAIVKLLQDAGPSDPDGVRTAWARLFGWRRTGSDIEVFFENAVDDLLAAGTLTSIDPLRLA